MKEYVKPELYCESFELSQHIAACGIDVNSADENSCEVNLDPDYWLGDNDIVFNDKCATNISTISVYCYTTGTNEAGRLFNS